MLRVVVELWPDGSESGRRLLASAKIGQVKSGALANYRIELDEDVTGTIGVAELRDYPRYASSIWDLVARSIAAALTGSEMLPPRPQQLDVLVRTAGNIPYVRLREIPEPARSLFKKRIAFSTRPLVEQDPEPYDCAYAWDFQDFLTGGK
jgi:hypothetical protein